MTANTTALDPEAIRRALDVSTDPLYIASGADVLVHTNAAFQDLCGYHEEELLGAPPTLLYDESSQAEREKRLQLLARDETTETMEWTTRLTTKSNAEIPVELHYRQVQLDDGDAYFIGRVSDLRQQTQLRQKLDILHRVLRHNIRNKMNIIVSNAVTLQEIEDPQYRTAAETIESVGQEIIDRSDKARRAQNHLEIPADEDCRVDLVTLTKHAIRKFEISFPNTDVTVTVPTEAQALAPPSFEVALVELLENAVIHHPSGEGPVDVQIEAVDGDFVVHVRDECEPFPSDTIATIQRGEEVPLQHTEGLGLWIVRWMADTVGAELRFDRREDDTGNVVTLRFDALNRPRDSPG